MRWLPSIRSNKKTGASSKAETAMYKHASSVGICALLCDPLRFLLRAGGGSWLTFLVYIRRPDALALLLKRFLFSLHVPKKNWIKRTED